jgi:hypothetical protein
MSIASTRMLYSCILLGLLAGCEGTQQVSPAAPPASAAPTPAAAATPATPPAAAPTAPTAASEPVDIHAPIDPIQISTRMELASPAVYVAAADMLRVRVRIFNDGQHRLVSAGSMMVNLGAQLLGPNGVDAPPGNRDFARAALPLIALGQSAELSVDLPAAPALGLPIRFELVQEGVNWFSAYGQPSLDLGSFQRCPEDASNLCDDKGHALKRE